MPGFDRPRDVPVTSRSHGPQTEDERRFLALLAAISEHVYRMSPTWGDVRDLGPPDPRSHRPAARSWLRLYVHPDDRPRAAVLIEEAIRDKRVFEMEHRYAGPDGTLGWMFSRAVPITNDVGSIVEWFGASTDITERKLREEALQQSEKRLQRELETTRTLLETNAALAEWTDLRSLLRALTQAVVRATDHKRATFALWNDRKREVQVVVSDGDEAIGPFTAPVEEFSSEFQRVVESLKTVVVDYDTLPGERKQRAEEVGSRIALLVPMVYHGRLVGGLMVDDPGMRVEFALEEIRLIEGIAAGAAVAVENARLYEAQSNIAATLQQALADLPEEIPGVRYSHLYRSATEEAAIGGDFYDLINLPHDGYLLLIGDVSGHGIEAARAATFVRHAVAAFATEDKSPQEILRDVNRALLRGAHSAFVAALVGHLSSDRRRFSFCSAGHPNLALRRAAGPTILMGGVNSPPLGIFADWSCNLREIPLLPGDVLLFYTDGVIEARAGPDMFGEERLIEWLAESRSLPLPELAPALLAEVLAFTGGSLQDDMAVVALEIMPEPAVS